LRFQLHYSSCDCDCITECAILIARRPFATCSNRRQFLRVYFMAVFAGDGLTAVSSFLSMTMHHSLCDYDRTREYAILIAHLPLASFLATFLGSTTFHIKKLFNA
jgi:hypothetical protein